MQAQQGSGESPGLAFVGDDEPEVQSQIEACQLIGTELLLEFAEVCDDVGVRFYLDAGTLLGAYRHGGWIPWDDDIDVAMFRDEYEILKANSDRFGEGLLLTDVTSSTEHVTSVPRLSYLASGLQWTERLGIRPPERQRIVLDIFIIDAAPDSRVARSILLRSTRVLQILLSLRATAISRILQERGDISVVGAVAGVAALVSSRLMPRHVMARAYQRIAGLFRSRRTTFVLILNHDERNRSSVFPRAIYEERSCRLEFEGRRYLCPDPETYLSTHYGPDFNSLPALSCRQPHRYVDFWARFQGRTWGHVYNHGGS